MAESVRDIEEAIVEQIAFKCTNPFDTEGVRA